VPRGLSPRWLAALIAGLSLKETCRLFWVPTEPAGAKETSNLNRMVIERILVSPKFPVSYRTRSGERSAEYRLSP